jgi:hypothetical protein
VERETVILAAGHVPSGPFHGQRRGAALKMLALLFVKQIKQFVEAAKPDTVDLSSCMRQYLGYAAEINWDPTTVCVSTAVLPVVVNRNPSS